jgi:predicted small secreted protein
MNNKMIRTLSYALLSAVLAGSLTACNTMEGAGKDIEEAGEEIQEESQDHQDTDND